ncbi:MAG: 6-pyruvoyl-tetrahydropterin synthase-related protein [Myxococcota bacterium]|nr:6-pyruvoyl-tetrahydropterin synthase-related protein [Myxococcota bacterium]
MSAALCWPLAQYYWFESHEGYTYVVRVAEYADAIRGGDLYPRWLPDFYNGYGSPYFVFYAPLLFGVSAVLAILTGSPVIGLKLCILFATMAAGIGMYKAVHGETRRVDAALLAAAAYLGAPYRITNVYVRGDLAEYTALSLLPWAIYFYRALSCEPAAERAVRFGFGAAICHGATILTHTITGFWGTAALFVVNLGSSAGLWKRHASAQIGMLWVAFGSALGMSAIYTVPALVEKRYVPVDTMLTGYHDTAIQYLMRADFMNHGGQFFLVPLLISSGTLSLVALTVPRRSVRPALWATGALACAFLSSRFGTRFWELRLPLQSFIQFPWRLHGIADLAASMSIGTAWAVVVRRGSWSDAGAVALGSIALLDAMPVVAVGRSMEPKSVAASPYSIRARLHSATNVNEYLPKVVTKYPDHTPEAVADSTSDIDVISSVSVGTDHALLVRVSTPAELPLALHQFPGWHVTTIAGPASATIKTTGAGLVAVALPTPGEYSLRVSFGSTPVHIVSGLASLLAVLALWPGLQWIASNGFRLVPWHRAYERLPALDAERSPT